MKNMYVVIKEWVEDYDECRFGYPQSWTEIPAAICETRESAEKLVETFIQTEADRFIDWLDECEDYIKIGMTDVSGYYDDDRPDRYDIIEVPFYDDAS